MSLEKLIMKSGPEAGKTYKLDKDEFVIGRELINDLIINDPEISRRHARVFVKNEKYYLEDLNSTNGTFLSGKQITKPVQLKTGDLINLGTGVILEFSSEKEAEKEINVVSEKAPEKKQEGTKEIKQASAAKKTAASKPVKKGETVKAEKPPLGIEKLRNTPTWVIVLVIILLFLLIFCVIPLLIVEWTDQWCNFFGTFFNQIEPGVCP